VRLRAIVIVILTFAVVLAGQQQQPVDPPRLRPATPAPPPGALAHQAEVEQALRRLATVFSVIEEQYADPVSPDKQIYQGAIPGMLRQLDPYSIFFDADQFHTLQQHQQAKTEGFGTIVSVMPGRVMVLEAFVGSPAARAGIQPGDEILEVNGYAVSRLGVEEIIELLGAARQQRAQIVVMRPYSNRVDTIIAVPAELNEASVDRAFFLSKGIGYLHVTGFEGNTAEEVKDALTKWGGELKGLVLDLRENHGGLVTSAVDTVGLFLPKGTLVLTARGRTSEQKQFLVEKSDPIGQKLPLVILVGNKTASAAEILAGALQDHGRAKLVGDRTYGKGTVQSVYPLGGGTGLALATARYVTPSGRFIERTRVAEGGIPPDYAVSPYLYSDFQAFLENHTLFLEFARKLRGAGRTFKDDFEVTPDLVDEFRGFLSELGVPVSQKIWSDNIGYIRIHLKIDISNLMFGVARGDQVAASVDPQVLRAVEVLTKGQ
jgi:carboxyl-terminal processing protease